MREYTLYIWIGVWLLVLSLPAFGIPGSWKSVLTVLTSLFIIGHALLGYRRAHLAGLLESELAPTDTETVQEEESITTA